MDNAKITFWDDVEGVEGFCKSEVATVSEGGVTMSDSIISPILLYCYRKPDKKSLCATFQIIYEIGLQGKMFLPIISICYTLIGFQNACNTVDISF